METEEGILQIAGDISAIASIILDMSAYLRTDGLTSFTAWLKEKHPPDEIDDKIVQENLTYLSSKFADLLFTA